MLVYIYIFPKNNVLYREERHLIFLSEDLNVSEHIIRVILLFQEMIDEADRDGDGEINESEFLRIMKKTSLY